MTPLTRRSLLRRLGLSAAALPFLPPLHLLRAQGTAAPPQRLIFVFSPNGTVPPDFWPDKAGTDFSGKRILEPLKPFWERMLMLKGVSNRVRGDGDGHMRGMSCLLTAIELFPGNIQGGGETPAGWASGPSIDQEIRKYYQSKPETTTRFGSLELGVQVPNRADPWTRWVYAGPNAPVAPLSDPYQVFEKLYGSIKDRENLSSVLDELTEDFGKVSAHATAEEKALLDKHLTLVREMEQDLKAAAAQKLRFPPPAQEAGVDMDNDGIPQISGMQIDMLVSALANDLTRIASLQYTASVGQARMSWLDIKENHHGLSHDPDLNKDSQEKLVKINQWFAGQIAALAQSWPIPRNPAAPAPCWITPPFSGRTNSEKETATPTRTSLSSSSAAVSAGKWAAPCSSTTSPTTASGSPSPTPAATASTPSEIRPSAREDRWRCEVPCAPAGTRGRRLGFVLPRTEPAEQYRARPCAACEQHEDRGPCAAAAAGHLAHGRVGIARASTVVDCFRGRALEADAAIVELFQEDPAEFSLLPDHLFHRMLTAEIAVDDFELPVFRHIGRGVAG